MVKAYEGVGEGGVSQEGAGKEGCGGVGVRGGLVCLPLSLFYIVAMASRYIPRCIR